MKAGGKAYTKAWGTYRKTIKATRERTAKEAGYETYAEQRAEAAIQRRKIEGETREAEETEMIRAEREKEKRVMERMTTARRKAAETLREISGKTLLEALEADWATVAEENVVRVPWAMWCQQKCKCARLGKGESCRNWGSERYETYRITEVKGSFDAEATGEQQLHATLERLGQKQEGNAKKKVRGKDWASWNRFEVNWRHLGGIERYGQAGKGMTIIARADGPDSLSSESESEQPYLKQEKMKAKRTARQRVADAAATEKAAEQEARAQEEMGAEGGEADGGETAAESAWKDDKAAEDEKTTTTETENTKERTARPSTSDPGNDKPSTSNRLGKAKQSTSEQIKISQPAPKEAAAEKTGLRESRGRAGHLWFQEAWMGQVAMAEFTTARRSGPTTEAFSESTQRAQETAIRTGANTAIATGRMAARNTAEDTRHRTEKIWRAGETRTEAAEEHQTMQAVAEAVDRWKEQKGLRGNTGPQGGRSVSGAAAEEAERHLSRMQPTTDAATACQRRKGLNAIAEVIEAEGGGKEEDEEEVWKTVMDALGLQRMKEKERATTRMMVRAILQSKGARAPQQEREEEREAPTGSGRAKANTQKEATERQKEEEGIEESGREKEQKTEKEDEAEEETGQQIGRIEIGKMEGWTRRPTTAAATQTTDVEADWRTPLGNVFTLPKRTVGEGVNEQYRTPTVKALRMMLHELEQNGCSDARRIAREGPAGKGWIVQGKGVTLPLDEGMMQKDPEGKLRWKEVQRLGKWLEKGEGDLRLLCHCRWTRRQAEGCRECHCEPTADYIEQEARRRRADMKEQRGEEGSRHEEQGQETEEMMTEPTQERTREREKQEEAEQQEANRAWAERFISEMIEETRSEHLTRTEVETNRHRAGKRARQDDNNKGSKPSKRSQAKIKDRDKYKGKIRSTNIAD